MARTVPAIASAAPGNYLTGALWNANVKATGDFLMGSSTNGVPRFRGYQATAQSIANNTWVNLSIDTTVYDSDNGHSNSTNNSRYVVQVAGTYLIIGSVGYAANATANRGIRICVNGSPVTGSFVKTTSSDASGSAGLVSSCHAVCSVGDYIEVQAHQNCGASLNTSTGSDVAPSLDVQWISG
ncbi:hypothetical protein ACWEQ7_04475 [Streptomyces sp. NPDC004069]